MVIHLTFFTKSQAHQRGDHQVSKRESDPGQGVGLFQGQEKIPSHLEVVGSSYWVHSMEMVRLGLTSHKEVVQSTHHKINTPRAPQ